MKLQAVPASEAGKMFEMIRKRVEWMDEKGISAWNKTHYLERYPAEYFEKKANAGELFFLQDEEGKTIAGTVLLESDPLWEEVPDRPAFYIHNLVAALGVPGAGKKMLKAVEEYAHEKGKEAVRLDCDRAVKPLNDLYQAEGYEVAGDCEEGLSLLREKTL